MSGSLSTKLRLVRCPRCQRILPEPANVPVYKCGGCDTVLRAKKVKNDTKDTDVRIPDTIVGKKKELEQDSEDKEAQNLSKEDIEARSLSKEDKEARSLRKEDQEAQSLSKEERLLCSLLLFGSFLRFGPRIEDFLWSVNYILYYRKKKEERLSSSGELPLDKNNGSDEKGNEDSNMNQSRITHHGNKESLPVAEADQDKCSLKQNNGGNPKEDVQHNGKHVGGLNFLDEVDSPTEPNHHKSAESEVDNSRNCMEEENGGGNFSDEVASPTEPNHHKSAERLSSAGELLLDKNNGSDEMENKDSNMNWSGITRHGNEESLPVEEDKCSLNQSNGGNPKDYVKQNGKRVGGLNFSDEVASLTEPNNHKSAESQADKNGNCVEEENGGVNHFDEVASSTEPNHLDSEESSLVAEARSEVGEIGCCLELENGRNQNEYGICSGKQTGGINFPDEVVSSTELQISVAEQRVTKLPLCLGGLTAKSASSSHWLIGLPDGRHIVVLDPLEQSTKDVSHADRVDQCSPTMSLPEKKMVRKTLKRKCTTMRVIFEIHQQDFGRRCEGSARSFCATSICKKHGTNRISIVKRSHKQHGIHQWPFRQKWATKKGYSAGDGRSFEANSLSMNEKLDSRLQFIHMSQCAKADESGSTVSNSEKGSMREALKRDSLTNSLSLKDLRQHFNARRKDAVKDLCDSLAWKSLEVLDSLPLGEQSNSIRHLARRRTLTHKHCVRLKKSQDLPRSLLRDCSGELIAQSATGLPDGGHIRSLSEKKTVRKTLKRRGRTTRLLSLEDHQQHVGRRWEDGAQFLGVEHICRQLAIDHESTAKRIRRQHWSCRWPFKQKWATRKGYSAGDKRSFEVSNLSMSPCAEADESGLAVSNSEKGSMREALKQDSLKDLRQHFGARRKDAAKGLCDSLAWKSFEVLDNLLLGEQSISIRNLDQRTALTQKHCVRLKKSQDLPRSLLSDCSGELAAQSATGLLDGEHIPSLSEKKIARNTLKRESRTMSVPSLEDHQQHVGRRWEDDANILRAKRICRQLAIDLESTAKRIRRQHGTRRWPFEQSAIGLPDEGYMLSLSKKKIMRKTLKTKCRNMSVLSLEYHQHVDSKWEDFVNNIGVKHIYKQLVIHRVSRAKRIHRQHGIHRWPFQQNLATCKGYFLGGERPDDVISLSMDGKLVSRLQLIHISWLGRFSPRSPALPPGGEIVEPPLALSSSQLPSTSNRAHLGGQDRSGSTTSHSQNVRTRDQPEGRKRKIKNLTIEDLRPYVGLTRADAAKKFQMSETTFKRQCRRLKIEQWPKLPPGEEVLKPPDPPERNTGQIAMGNEVGRLPEPIEVSRLPYHPQNGSLQDYIDDLLCGQENDSMDFQSVWQEMESNPNPNPDVFLQTEVTSTHMVSGNMGIPNDHRNSLASQAETRLKGHGTGSSLSQRIQDMSFVTLKVYGLDTIKFKFPLASGINELKGEVAKRLNLEPDSFNMKYEDEEGEQILIPLSEDLRDYLSSSITPVIKLWVVSKVANLTNLCESCGGSLKR